MALRRRYAQAVDGRLRVVDEVAGDISQLYENAGPREGAFARILAELFIADGPRIIALNDNGEGRDAVRACMDLLHLYEDDLALAGPDPRAF